MPGGGGEADPGRPGAKGWGSVTTYRYRAVDGQGRVAEGLVAAADEGSAVRLLRMRGLQVEHLSHDGCVQGPRAGPASPQACLSLPASSPPTARAPAGLAGRLGSLLRRRGGVPREKVIAFFSHLQVLLASGVGVVPALKALRLQEDSAALLAVLNDLIARVERGAPLSAALQAHPQVFPRFTVAMVRNGELAGNLQGNLRDVAGYLERDLALERKIRRAIQYPAFVVATAAFMTFVLFRFVLPGLLGGLGSQGGGLAARALHLGIHLVNQPLLLLGSLALAGFVSWRLGAWLGTGAGQAALEAALLRLPFLGKMASLYPQVRVCRCMAAQLRSGLQVLPSLKLTADVCASHAWSRHLSEAARVLASGATLSAALAVQEAPHSALLVSLVRAGEEAGELDRMLDRAALLLEGDLECRLEAAIHLLEPLLIAGAGMITLLVLLAVISTLQGGLTKL